MTIQERITPTRERLAKGDVRLADTPDKGDRRKVIKGRSDILQVIEDHADISLPHKECARWMSFNRYVAGLEPSVTANYGEFLGGSNDNITDRIANARAVQHKLIRSLTTNEHRLYLWLVNGEVDSLERLGSRYSQVKGDKQLRGVAIGRVQALLDRVEVFMSENRIHL